MSGAAAPLVAPGGTIRTARAAASARLAAAGDPDPVREAALLVATALGRSLAATVGAGADPWPADATPRLADLVARRSAGEPTAYLRGTREFYGLDFRVSPAVLVPRPETEGVVEVLRQRHAAVPLATVADVGTGSGAIACAVAHATGARVHATDADRAALAVARANADALGVADRVTFHQGDLAAPLLAAGLGGRLDALAANLPYVPDSAEVEREVRFEPAHAVFAGPDGLTLIRRLLPDVPRLLRPGGVCVLEIDFGQAEAVAALVAAAGLHLVAIHPDLAGIPRVVEAKSLSR